MSLKKRKKLKKIQNEKRKNARRTASSEKFERERKPVKKVLPGSLRGLICLVGGIIMAACCFILLWTVIRAGADAPMFFGALGLFNMGLSVFFIYQGAICLSDKEHAKGTARIGVAINAIVVIAYLFLYIIGL